MSVVRVRDSSHLVNKLSRMGFNVMVYVWSMSGHHTRTRHRPIERTRIHRPLRTTVQNPRETQTSSQQESLCFTLVKVASSSGTHAGHPVRV